MFVNCKKKKLTCYIIILIIIYYNNRILLNTPEEGFLLCFELFFNGCAFCFTKMFYSVWSFLLARVHFCAGLTVFAGPVG